MRDDNPDRYELEPGLYVLDSSGTAPDGEAMRRRADKISREVEEAFEPQKVRPVKNDYAL